MKNSNQISFVVFAILGVSFLNFSPIYAQDIMEKTRDPQARRSLIERIFNPAPQQAPQEQSPPRVAGKSIPDRLPLKAPPPDVKIEFQEDSGIVVLVPPALASQSKLFAEIAGKSGITLATDIRSAIVPIGSNVGAVAGSAGPNRTTVYMLGGDYDLSGVNINGGTFRSIPANIAAEYGLSGGRVTWTIGKDVVLSGYAEVGDVDFVLRNDLVLKDSVKIRDSHFKIEGGSLKVRASPHTVSISGSIFDCGGGLQLTSAIVQEGGSGEYYNNKISNCSYGIYAYGAGTFVKSSGNEFSNLGVTGVGFTCLEDDQACWNNPPDGFVSTSTFNNVTKGVVVIAGAPTIAFNNSFSSDVLIGLENRSPHTYASNGNKKVYAVGNQWNITNSNLTGPDSLQSISESSTIGSLGSIHKNVLEIYNDGAPPNQRPRTQLYAENPAGCNLIRE